jgi:hypothetical protein
LPSSSSTSTSPAKLLFCPVTLVVAVLRYRLWDLDRLISRTVTYALVTALLVLPGLLIVPAAWLAAPGNLAVAAALFALLRRRVQQLSTGVSSADGMTPPAPWRRPRPVSATRHTASPRRYS